MKLFDRFNLGHGFRKYFRVQAAVSDTLRDDVYRIRHEVYCEELKFEPERPDRRETDQYDRHSMHCLIRTSTEPDNLVGCTRLILTDPADRDRQAADLDALDLGASEAVISAFSALIRKRRRARVRQRNISRTRK